MSFNLSTLMQTILRKKPTHDDEKSDIGENIVAPLSETEIEPDKPQSDSTNVTERESKFKEQKRKETMALIKKSGMGLVGLIVIYGLHLLFKPFEGGIGFGTCKVFLEQYVRYPSTINYRSVEDYNSNVRIWFTHIDAFGEYKLEALRCYFGPEPEGQIMPGRGFMMNRATINRRDLDQTIIDQFNLSIPAIRAHPPSLVYPPPIPDALEDIQFKTDLLRRQLF